MVRLSTGRSMLATSNIESDSVLGQQSLLDNKLLSFIVDGTTVWLSEQYRSRSKG